MGVDIREIGVMGVDILGVDIMALIQNITCICKFYFFLEHTVSNRNL